ncbi:RDD family domain-containing protein [Ditylenchus destructor]|nr:RDD family domain-containing protein [Ditylenchus destructor]
MSSDQTEAPSSETPQSQPAQLTNPNEPKDYGTAKAYTEEVRKWMAQTQLWMACQQMSIMQHLSMQMNQQYMASMMASANQVVGNNQFNVMQINNMPGAQAGVRPQLLRRIVLGANFGRLFQNANQMQPRTIIAQQHTIPSFLRRIMAEAIDCIILFLFKLFVVYLMVELEIMDLEQFDKILTHDADLQTLIDITQGLFNIEILCKIASALLEAFCVSFGFANYPAGCTPGKFMMRIKVISCLDIQPVPGTQDRVVVTSLPSVSLKSSLIRSLLKNVMTVFLFPLSTAFYIFNFNRAIYDLAAKTVVVNM